MNDPSVWISLSLAALTALSIWTNYRMNRNAAGRVTVMMNVALYKPFSGISSLITNNDGQFKLPKEVHPVVEMCQIVIENPGRFGATVTNVEIVIVGLARGTYRVTPRGFETDAFQSLSATRSTHFRLEPYDQRTLLFDYWSIIDAEFKDDPSLREITVYAQVKVAGHPDPMDSKKHGYWTIRRDFVSCMGNLQERFFRNVILAEFARQSADLQNINYLDDIVVDAEEDLGPDVAQKDLEKYLTDQLAKKGALIPEEAQLWPIMTSYNACETRKTIGSQVKGLPIRPYKLKDPTE